MLFRNRPTTVGIMVAGFIAGCIVPVAHADDVAEFSAPLNVEYERSDTDYAQYDRLLIKELDLSDTIILPPPWLADQPFPWEVSDENLAHLQNEFMASMTEQITSNGGYPIVTEPGPGVMQLELTVVSFMPYAEQKDNAVTRGSGEMRINVEVRDAQTGELLGMYEGPQEVGKEYQKNSDFTKQQNAKMLFDSWGRRVRIAMDEDHGRN